jgi:hypothetical protein
MDLDFMFIDSMPHCPSREMLRTDTTAHYNAYICIYQTGQDGPLTVRRQVGQHYPTVSASPVRCPTNDFHPRQLEYQIV